MRAADARSDVPALLLMVEYQKNAWHGKFSHKRLCYISAMAGTFIFNLLYALFDKYMYIQVFSVQSCPVEFTNSLIFRPQKQDNKRILPDGFSTCQIRLK